VIIKLTMISMCLFQTCVRLYKFSHRTVIVLVLVHVNAALVYFLVAGLHRTNSEL